MCVYKPKWTGWSIRQWNFSIQLTSCWFTWRNWASCRYQSYTCVFCMIFFPLHYYHLLSKIYKQLLNKSANIKRFGLTGNQINLLVMRWLWCTPVHRHFKLSCECNIEWKWAKMKANTSASLKFIKYFSLNNTGHSTFYKSMNWTIHICHFILQIRKSMKWMSFVEPISNQYHGIPSN